MDEKAHPYGWAFFSGGFWLAEAHWTSRLSLFLRVATILARRLAMDPFEENRPDPIPSQTRPTCPQCQGNGRCTWCSGSGRRQYPGFGPLPKESCPVCSGSGCCLRCSGSGKQ